MTTKTTRIDYNLATGQISGASSLMGPMRDVIRKIRKQTDNLRGLFDSIADDFYATNEKLVFSDDGRKFPQLSDIRREDKAVRIGEVHPILVGETGDLRESLTNRFSRNAEVQISGKSMRIRSLVPYSGFHQTGTTRNSDGTIKMPKRPPIDLTDKKRNLRWANMASAWALRDLGVKI